MSKHEESNSGLENPPGSGGTGSGELKGSLHTPVSSESGEGYIEEEELPVVDQIAESFEGNIKGGELESFPDFNQQRALNEGMHTKILTSELMELPELRPEGFQPKDVCGQDDRVQVMNTTIIPWKWICELILTFPNGQKYRGTGWFIGLKAVMTAGHCVYSKADGGWASEIEVIPGMQGANRPFGSMIGKSFRSVTGWTQKSDPNYDYGCIILPSPDLGNKVGYFGFAALTDASLQNLLVNNSGYPGDKPFGTQWFNAGRVTKFTDQKIYYMIDTYGGQSGSPVWRLQNSERHAIGIHAYGGCPNSATRITTPVFNNMMNWRNS